VYDFQPVSVSELDPFPLIARNDVAVQFDRHAIRLHPKSLNQAGQTNGRVETPVFSVDEHFHVLIFASRSRFVQVSEDPSACSLTAAVSFFMRKNE
jgi:hypothetical protein